MPHRIAISTLNASTVDILNVIRANAGGEYQSMVPKIRQATEIPKVGEVVYGYPAVANKFLNTLLNRIALVLVRSATFNNPYADLKKGYLEFGETVEESFVGMAKAREFSAEKAAAREFKRSLPDVRTAFHIMNWRVQYPVSIQDMDLYQAFTALNGVQDMIAKITRGVYTGADYDEFLLFKYMIIKAVTKGMAYPIEVADMDFNNQAVAFRGYSNLLMFMNPNYNAAGVHTVTPRDDQYIFMDALYNASFDVNVLASAFNMDKATFMGHLKLIDTWDTFDNKRFDEIMQNTDMIEPVTEEELAFMKRVKAVIADREFFQVYDNQNKFTEKYVASGEYWNYFYNTWKTVSPSPFSNIIVFLTPEVQSTSVLVTKPSTQNAKAAVETPQATNEITLPASFTATVTEKAQDDDATVLALGVQNDDPNLIEDRILFSQGESATTQGVGVQPYGALLFGKDSTSASVTLTASVLGQTYQGATPITTALKVGDTVTFNKQG